MSQTFLVGFDPQQLNYKIYKLSDNKTTDKSGERNTQLFSKYFDWRPKEQSIILERKQISLVMIRFDRSLNFESIGKTFPKII